MARDERLLPLPNADLPLKPARPDIPATYAPIYDGDTFAEKRSIREYLNVVLKRKWMILALVTIVSLSTAIYMYRQPSIYQSQAQVLIETRQNKQSDKAVTLNLWYDTRYWDTQVKLIQNPNLMRDAVVALNLHKSPTLPGEQTGPGLFGAVGNLVTGTKPTATKTGIVPVLTTDSAAISGSTGVQLTPEEEKRAEEYGKFLVSGLKVEPVEKTNLINLKFESTNPDLAANIPNALAKVFIANDVKREMQGSIQATQDNARQITDLQENIARLEQDRINYMRAADLPLGEQKGENLTADRLQTYSANWLAAEKERRDLQAQYEAAVRAKDKGEIYSVVSDNIAIQKARELERIRKAELEKGIEEYDRKIAEQEQKKAALSVKYQPEYWEVKATDEQIASLTQAKENLQRTTTDKIQKDGQKLMREAEKETLTGLQSRFQAAQKRESEFRASYFQERQAANAQGQSQAKLTTLTQEIETNRKLLDSALQRQKELELAANSSRPNNIKISTEAQGPVLIGPRRNQNTLIAFLISLAIGIGLAFLLDYLDDSVKSSDDVGRHLGLPTLAMIPHYASLQRSLARPGLTAGNAANGGAASTALISLDDTRSALAEAYRHLRTSLLFSSAGKPPQTILVTSSQPSEGKTTTAINTAITLAQGGAEVVIIDCDLRRPRLHHHFEMENGHGLTNFLSGERNLKELLKPCDKLPSLKVITSGPLPPNPAELLGSNEMRNLIEFLRTNFKHVVVDSPPAISFTDAAILSTLVDGVIIVAMAGKSSIHLIKRFKQRLNTVGARIYGVVLNGLKRNSVDYGYYGYGYSYYTDYYNDEPAEPTNGSESKKSVDVPENING